MKATIIKPEKQDENKQQRKLRVAAYARVSTTSEEQKSSFVNQIEYYENKIKENPDWEFAGVYFDEGISGTTDDRPGFQRMIRQAQAKKIDLILTKSISRFSRSGADLIHYTEILKNLNVNVRFEENNIDLLSPAGKTMLYFSGLIAEMEIENLSDNVKWALRKKMQNSKLVGRGYALGYDVQPIFDNNGRVIDRKLVINEEEAKIVRYIFKRYLEGIGAGRIAKELINMGAKTKTGSDTWYTATVSYILQNEKYIGTLLQGKTVTINPIGNIRKKNRGIANKYMHENAHDPIISKEDFNKVQELMKSRRTVNKDGKTRGTTRNSTLTVFTSKIKCFYCGNTFVKRRNNYGTKWESVIWQCSTYIVKGKKFCPHCKYVREEKIKTAFVGLLNNLMTGKDNMIYLSDELFSEHVKATRQEISDAEFHVKKIKQNIQEKQRMKRKLLRNNLQGIVSDEDYIEENEELEKEIRALQEEVNELKDLENIKEKQIKTEKEIRELIKANDPEAFNPKLFELMVAEVIIGGIPFGATEDDPKMISIILKDNTFNRKVPMLFTSDYENLDELKKATLEMYQEPDDVDFNEKKKVKKADEDDLIETDGVNTFNNTEVSRSPNLLIPRRRSPPMHRRRTESLRG